MTKITKTETALRNRWLTCLLLIIGWSSGSLNAQNVSTYDFAQFSGVYASIGSGTSALGPSIDDASGTAQNIGFNFVYHGVTFTQFTAQSNGYIALGGSITQDYVPLNSVTECISFAGGDGRSGPSGIYYAVSGSAPNRILTIEQPSYYYSYQSTTNYVDVQIKLFETSNMIQIIYGAGANTGSYTRQLGINGATVSDFAVRTTTTNWSNTTTAGTNSGTMTVSSTVLPANGQMYVFSPNNTYCGPGATTQDETITNVTLGSINNSSGWSAGGYGNYFATTNTTLITGNSHTITASIAPFYSGDNMSCWIDYNHNGVFEASELTVMSPAASSTGSINVPSGALLGVTRMRVRLEYFGSNDPCNSQTYGEIEDYKVTIAPPTGCVGVPSPGNTLSTIASVCSGVSFTLSLQNSTLGTGVTYQWQSSPNGSTWTNFGTNSATQTISQSSPTYYQSIVTCTGNGSGTSNSIFVGLNTFISCYCIPTTSNGCLSGDHITNVTVTTIGNPINNSTGTCITASYSDYTGSIPAAQATQNDLIPISVSVSNGGQEYAGAWIDYNQSGTFEPGEFIALTDADLVAPWIYTGTALVPVAAQTGLTRMRFRSSYSTAIGASSACDNYSYGETEDYFINITATSNCSGTPTPGNTLTSSANPCPNGTFNLSLQNIPAGSGVTYQWQSSPDGSTWSNIGAPTTNSIFTIGHSVATYYRSVVTCAFGGSGTSNSLLVGVNTFFNCYCTSGLGGSCGINAMSSVAIQTTTLNNVTGGCVSTYNSYPASGSTTALLIPGSNYTMDVGVIAGSNTQVAIWIDYNQDGNYSPAEYTLINGNIPSGGSGSGSFTVPLSALGGSTSMRVRSDWQGTTAWTPADACALRTWGETEDYTITISPLPATPPNPIEVGIPNCATGGTLQAVGSAPSGETWYWQSTATSTSTSQNASTPLTILANGTYYIRSQNNTYLTWSIGAGSVTVTDFPSGPSDPTVSAPGGNPACGTVTLFSSVASSGTTNYWQGTNPTGTSTATIADNGTINNSFPVIANGVYYLRSRDNNSLCWSNPVAVNVTIWALPTSPIVSATPSTICPGTPVSLTAVAPSAPAPGYTVASIPFSPVSPSAGTLAGPIGDDTYSSSIPLGFNFNFYGTNYSNIFISTNGFASFDASSGAGCCTGQIIPSNITPNNVIALAWQDLNTGSGGNIDYFNETSPNRFIIRYNNVSAYTGAGGVGEVNGQIVIYQDGIIELHTSSITLVGNLITQGIENATGTLATAVPGRNSSAWNTTNDARRFTPTQPIGYLWTPNGPGSGIASGDELISNITANPTSTITYTMTLTESLHGCQSSNSVLVTTSPVAPAPSTTGGATACGSGTVTLSATGTGGTLNWYDLPSGGTLLGSGSPFITPSINATTTFYVEEFNGACAGPRVAVLATYTTAPVASVSSDVNFVCNGGTNTGPGGNNNNTVNLTASSAYSYTSYTWTSNPSGYNATGQSVSDTPVETTIYTVTASDGSCNYVNTITVNVGNVPNISSVTATPQTVCQGNTSQFIAAVAGGSGGVPPTYCTSILTSGNYCGLGNGALTNVAIVGTTLNNNSVCNWNATNGTYTSYPAIGSTTAGLVLGQTYTISVSCNSVAIVSLFIDYDQDGQFEPTEWTQVYTNSASGTASFTVPVTATPGATGMRVRSRLEGNANGSGDQCLSMGSGSTDDYTINILGGIGFNFAWTGSGLNNNSIFNPIATLGSSSQVYNVTVTDPTYGCFSSGSITLSEPVSIPGNTLTTANPVCPSQVFTLSTQFSPPGANYSWQSSPDGITWTDLGISTITYGTTITTPTYFRANVGCISSSNFTPPLLINVSPFLDCYCASAANSTIDEEIYQVSLNGASTNPLYANDNGCTTVAPGPGSVLSSYSNFKTLGALTTVFQGASVPWEVRQNECDGSTYYPAGIAIFIDYNQNGSFTDPGETIYQEPITSAATGLSPGGDKVVSGFLTVPLTALSGNTVMRIICAEGISGIDLTPCLIQGYGETEDFLINIGDPNCVGIPIFPGNGDQICPDDNLALSWAAKAGATGYDVYLDANNPNPTTLVSANQSGTSYSPGSFVTTNTYYWKVVPLFNVGSCATPQTFSYSFKPAPQPSGTSNSPVCEGQSVSFFGNNTASGQTTGNSYLWTGPNGFNDIVQNPTLSNATAAASGTYSVEVTNQFGCSSSITTIVTVAPLPALNILSQTNVSCNGGFSGEFTIQVTNGSGFYLYDQNGNINFDGNFTGFSAGTYIVQVTDGNSCASSIPVTITQPDPTTIPDAGQDQTLCAGTTVTLAGNVAAVGTGTWTVVTGSGTFANANDPLTTVTGVGAGLNTYAWTIDNALCFISNADNVNVTTNAVPTATVSGATSICNGQSANLTLDFTGTGPWTYSYSNGSTTFGPFTTSNNPEIVQVSPTSATTYSLVTLDDTNCSGTVSGSALITVVNNPPIGSIQTFTGPTTACFGNIATITTNAVLGATSYTWSGPSGTLFDGQPGPYSTATNSVSVEFGILGTTSGYSICATAVNACGQSNTRCFWIRGTVSTPAPIAGSTVGCANTTGPYSTSAVVGAANYFWTASPQMQVIAGQGTQNVTIRFLASFTSGTICVAAVTSCGSTSTARCMTVNRATASPGYMNGPFAQCPGQTGQVFSIDPVVGAASYAWTLPSNTTLTSGQGTPSITLSVGSTFSVGNICVTATSICGIVSAPRCKTISSVQPNTPSNITGPNSGVCGQSIIYSVLSQAGVTNYNWVVPAGATLVGGAGTNTVQVAFASNFTTGQLCVTAENGCGSSIARCVNIKGVPADLSVISGPNPVCSFDAGALYFINPAFGATSYVWTVPAGATIVAGQGTNAIIVDYGLGGGLITVKAVNACGQSGTRTLNVIVNCRMAGSLPNATLNAYPNPVSSELTIDLDAVASGSYSVELLDLSGRIVKSEVMNAIIGLNRNSMDVSSLAKGMYMLNVKNEEGFSQQLRIAVE